MISCAMRKFFIWNPNGKELETNIWIMCEKFQELWFYRLQIVGLKLEEIVFSWSHSNIANKVWLLLECDLRIKLFFDNCMPYFIRYIHAKFQKLMNVFAKDAPIALVVKKV